MKSPSVDVKMAAAMNIIFRAALNLLIRLQFNCKFTYRNNDTSDIIKIIGLQGITVISVVIFIFIKQDYNFIPLCFDS